jgi:hypothetical protein
MKGRVYDPRVGQFLTPDPLVVSPFASQAYNRYAYVLNNPLRYIDPTGFQSCDSASCGGGGGSGEWFGPSLGSEGAGSFPLAPASFAPTFSDVGGASTEGSGGTSGMDVEATFGERALYLGAGVGVGAGTSYAIGKGVLLVCSATGVCTAAVVAVAVVAGTAYVVHDLFLDGGAEQIVNAFTEFKTKEDAFIVGQTLGGVVGVAGWQVVLLPRLLPELPTDPLYGLLALTEFWGQFDFPSDGPHVVQRPGDTEYYTERNYAHLIEKHRVWLEAQRVQCGE